MNTLPNCYHLQMPGQFHTFQDLFAAAKCDAYIHRNKLKHLNIFHSFVQLFQAQNVKNFSFGIPKNQFTKSLTSMSACQMHTCEAMYIAAAATEIGERPGTMSSSTAFRAMCVAAR
jgi:hypothetical protein